mgnify:CR=1 FL=1
MVEIELRHILYQDQPLFFSNLMQQRIKKCVMKNSSIGRDLNAPVDQLPIPRNAVGM